MVVLNVYDMVSAARPAPLARGSDPGPAPPPPADARVGEGSGVVFQSSRASVLPGAPRAAAAARVDGGRPRAPARRGPRPWARHPAEEPCPSGPASLAGPTSDSTAGTPGAPRPRPPSDAGPPSRVRRTTPPFTPRLQHSQPLRKSTQSPPSGAGPLSPSGGARSPPPGADILPENSPAEVLRGRWRLSRSGGTPVPVMQQVPGVTPGAGRGAGAPGTCARAGSGRGNPPAERSRSGGVAGVCALWAVSARFVLDSSPPKLLSAARRL